MTTKRFKLTGDYLGLHFSVEGTQYHIARGETFETSDEAVIRLLKAHPKVEEVKKADEEAGKRPRPADAKS